MTDTKKRRPTLAQLAMPRFRALLLLLVLLAAARVSDVFGQGSGRTAVDTPASAGGKVPQPGHSADSGQVEMSHPQHAIAFLNALKEVLHKEKYNTSSSGGQTYAMLEHDLINVFNEQNRERHFRKISPTTGRPVPYR